MKLKIPIFGLGSAGGGSGSGLPKGVERKGNTILFDQVRGTITLQIKGQGGLQLRFDDSDPIWSCTGTDCPEQPGNILQPANCPHPHKSLTIDNSQPTGSYAYTLRFLDGNDKSLEFDPIIKNIA